MDNRLYAGIGARAVQKTAMRLGGQQLLGLSLLAKPIEALRSEIVREIAANPVLEDLDHPLERSMSDVIGANGQSRDDFSPLPDEDFTPLERRYDEEALERRQAMFDNQTSTETLQRHLSLQIPVSDLAPEDYPLAEALIGDLDTDGYYRGSIPDVCMVFGRGETKVRAVLREISTFDPLGCGATSAQECLRAQLSNIADSRLRLEVGEIIDHLNELALDPKYREAHAEAFKALQTLEPHPGRPFLSEKDRVEYLNPEVHCVRDDRGHWCAITDRRSLPEIRISPKSVAMAADPNQSEDVRRYLSEKIERARDLRAAIIERQSTIENIAQAIFDRQQQFFSEGFKALRPMTEMEIAKAVDLAPATVSRAVNDKYADTPHGVIALRRFFTSGVTTAAGQVVSQDVVLQKLKDLVAAEDGTRPLTDSQLQEAMKGAGYPIARRTVAKYRDRLGIPEVSRRRRQ